LVHETRKVVILAVVMLALAAALVSLRLLLAGPAGDPPAAQGWASVLDLTRLPKTEQSVLAVLLLLPAGALLTAVVRNIVGVATFGTFAPVLLGLSFVYSDAVFAAVVFGVVMVVGLAGRWLLGRFRLLMVPRLGVLLTLVVLGLALAVSVLHQFGSRADRYAILLPLVATTMLVERFYVCQEEDGPRLAWTLMLGTLAVAAGCLGLLKSPMLGRLLLRFPELLLALAAAMLLVGRYSGYRISELIRFRDLRELRP
jgi:hypothetical protein